MLTPLVDQTGTIHEDAGSAAEQTRNYFYLVFQNLFQNIKNSRRVKKTTGL